MKKFLELITDVFVIFFFVLPPTLLLLGYLYESFLLWSIGSAILSRTLLLGLELMLPDKYFIRTNPPKEFLGLTFAKWLKGLVWMPLFVLISLVFLIILFPNYDI